MEAKIVMMADNQKDLLDVRREFLERAGYTVITASNPNDAEKILERGGLDLAVMDIRLKDDEDEEDTSGLELARKYGRFIPIIMLTQYPSWELVKASLGPDLHGLSPAVDFLSKQEGPELMIQAVNLTIEHPRLKHNMLHEFQAESSQALHEVMQKKEPAETSDIFQKSLERTERDLLQYRKKITQQAGRYQKIAVWVGLVGIAVILVGILLFFFERIPWAVLSGGAGLAADTISLLFIRRASRASQQVDQTYKELQDIYKAGHLISICDTIESKSKRENAKLMIVEKLAGKWIG